MSTDDRLMVSVSGVRGTVGGTLTGRVAYDFGCAFGTFLGAGKVVVLGSDTRPSGPMVKAAVAAGLMATGCEVVDLGVVTTPGTALMTRLLEADGGIVITASHNPHPYNGIKFLQPSGVGLSARQAGQLKDIWQKGKYRFQQGFEVGTLAPNSRTHTRHVDAVCDVVDVNGIAARRFKVVLDSINGAGCVVTPTLLSKLGCEVVPLNAEPTGQFAHPPEPIAENLTSLSEAVRRHGADVGFAQDPDADRLAIVDETGRFIGEEYTLAICAAYVLGHRKGHLATNLSTSRMIDDLAGAAGVEVHRVPTGEANVVETLLKHRCIFGGEGNGGVIDPRVVPVRDSLVGMAFVLQRLFETGRSVSQLVADIPAYHLQKTKLPCPAGAAEEIIRRTVAVFDGRDDVRFNTADGLRIDLPDAWVSVRASNTEPILRIFAEAPSEQAADELIAQVRDIADSVIG
jgi:phosphomannomutase